MNPPSKKHRHFVALPAFLFITLAMVAIPMTSLQGEASNVVDSQFRRIAPGTYMTGDDTAKYQETYQGIELHKGSFLVTTDNVSHVRTGKLDIFSAPGAYHITVREDVLTVAALTTPVLIQDHGARILIPAGRQWRREGELALLEDGYEAWISDRMLSEVPDRFRQKQLARLRLLEEVEEGVTPPSLKDHPVFDRFKLPAASQRTQERQGSEVTEMLAQAIDVGDGETIRTLLLEPFFQSESGKRVLLQSLDTEASFIRHQLLVPLMDDTTVRLLLAIHPTIRAPGWTAIDASLSLEEALALLVSIPQSDRAPEPLEEAVYSAWSDDVVGLAEHLPKKSVFLHAWVEAFAEIVHRNRDRNMPLRAERLEEALENIIDQFDYVLPEETEKLLEESKDAKEFKVAESLNEPQPGFSTPDSAEGGEVAYTPDEVLSIATDMIRATPALFTVDTRIVAVSPQTAQVENVVYSSPSGDRSVTFVLNVSTKTASEIYVGSKKYPNPMMLSRLVDWLTRG